MSNYHTRSDLLLVCDNCGYTLAFGKYEPLFKLGKKSANCNSDMRRVNSTEADRMLSVLAPGRGGSE